MCVFVTVLLRMRGCRLATLSELPRSLLQALYLVLRLWASLQDGPTRQKTRRLLLALPRHRTQAVRHDRPVY